MKKETKLHGNLTRPCRLPGLIGLRSWRFCYSSASARAVENEAPRVRDIVYTMNQLKYLHGTGIMGRRMMRNSDRSVSAL